MPFPPPRHPVNLPPPRHPVNLPPPRHPVNLPPRQPINPAAAIPSIPPPPSHQPSRANPSTQPRQPVNPAAPTRQPSRANPSTQPRQPINPAAANPSTPPPPTRQPSRANPSTPPRHPVNLPPPPTRHSGESRNPELSGKAVITGAEATHTHQPPSPVSGGRAAAVRPRAVRRDSPRIPPGRSNITPTISAPIIKNRKLGSLNTPGIN